MDISYRNNKLKKGLSKDSEMIKQYGTLAKPLKQRINELKAADSLYDISLLPALRLHPYKADRKGEWSIDIKGNWRIVFEIDHDPIPKDEDGGVSLRLVTAIKIISIEDPH